MITTSKNCETLPQDGYYKAMIGALNMSNVAPMKIKEILTEENLWGANISVLIKYENQDISDRIEISVVAGKIVSQQFIYEEIKKYFIRKLPYMDRKMRGL